MNNYSELKCIMGKYYGVTWSSDNNSLSHYGIFGQKWGIRRFQYENGSYTEEGKKRYGRQMSDDKAFKKAVKDHLQSSNGEYKDKKRANAAAELGIQALKKMGRDVGDDPWSDATKEWFLYEDQTSGLPVIADLVNRGYSSDDIGKLIDMASNSDPNTKNSKTYDLIFNLTETVYNDEGKKFAKACEEIKKSENETDAIIFERSDGSGQGIEYKKFNDKIDRKIRNDYKSEEELKKTTDDMKQIFSQLGYDLSKAFGNGGPNSNSFNQKSESEQLYIMLMLADNMGLFKLPKNLFD